MAEDLSDRRRFIRTREPFQQRLPRRRIDTASCSVRRALGWTSHLRVAHFAPSTLRFGLPSMMKTRQPAIIRLNFNDEADLDGLVGRDLKIRAGTLGVSGEEDKEVLPP